MQIPYWCLIPIKQPIYRGQHFIQKFSFHLSYYRTLSLPRHYLVPGKSMMMTFHRLLKIISRKYADFIFPIEFLLNRHFRDVNISSRNSVFIFLSNPKNAAR